MSDQMDAAHRKDYAEKDRADRAIRAIDELLAVQDEREGRVEVILSRRCRDALHDDRERLKRKSDHVVAVWD